jgi:hypothetical protein
MSLLTTQPRTLMTAHLHYVGESIRYPMTPHGSRRPYGRFAPLLRLGACARATEESFRYCSDTPERARAHWADPNAKLAMILFLYMAGDEDVVRMVHPGERPIKETVRRHDPKRFKDLAAPTIYSVGRSFGRTVERWETERGTDVASEITRGTVRPHHRAAHYHR